MARGSNISPWLLSDAIIEGAAWTNTYSQVYAFGDRPSILVMVSHPGLVSPFWEIANLFVGTDAAMTVEERVRAIRKVIIPQTLRDDRYDLAVRFQSLVAQELMILGERKQAPITGNPAAEAIAAIVCRSDSRSAKNCFNTLRSCGYDTDQAKGSTETQHKQRIIRPEFQHFADTAFSVIEQFSS